jgi:hypothetical protein
MSIPCHSRLIVDDGILRADNTVKQCGLANVRAAYDCDDVAGHSIEKLSKLRIEELQDYKITEL